MNLTFTLLKKCWVVAAFTLLPYLLYGQGILTRTVSVNVRQQPVSEVLRLISKQGHFYFSFNSSLVPTDSLVTLQATRPVKQVLDLLFKNKFQYKEKGEYLIILPAPKERVVYVSGHVFDLETNQPVDYASVYVRQQLVSTLSADNGSFRLRLRDKTFPLSLTVSKVGYGDTTLVLEEQLPDSLTIGIVARAIELDPMVVRYSDGASTWLGQRLLSSRLRLQGRNISQFFVALPYQTSLVPGLGTHGRMSSQVVNKVSLNLLGGYTAGVNGVEIAGGFNITKKDIRYLQVAGGLNIVSGHVNGVQIAGMLNHVLDSVQGVQLSGAVNIAKRALRGAQVSGAFNRAASTLHGAQVSAGMNLLRDEGTGVQVSAGFNQTTGTFRGVQLTAGVNRAAHDIRGAQISALVNLSKTNLRGLQLGVFNRAKNLQGVQIGIVNRADSSAGYSIGLFNFIKKNNASSLSFFATEVIPFNLAWKMGTPQFYSFLFAGAATGPSAYTLGLGIGKEWPLTPRLDLLTEISQQNFYLGTWKGFPILSRLQPSLSYKLGQSFRLWAGPAWSLFQASDQTESTPGYKKLPITTYPGFTLGTRLHTWLGWQIGLSWRYGRAG